MYWPAKITVNKVFTVGKISLGYIGPREERVRMIGLFVFPKWKFAIPHQWVLIWRQNWNDKSRYKKSIDFSYLFSFSLTKMKSATVSVRGRYLHDTNHMLCCMWWCILSSKSKCLFWHSSCGMYRGVRSHFVYFDVPLADISIWTRDVFCVHAI